MQSDRQQLCSMLIIAVETMVAMLLPARSSTCFYLHVTRQLRLPNLWHCACALHVRKTPERTRDAVIQAVILLAVDITGCLLAYPLPHEVVPCKRTHQQGIHGFLKCDTFHPGMPADTAVLYQP